MNFIVAHGVFLEAIGVIGNYLYYNHPSDWKSYIKKLSKIDWSRTNSNDWLGRAFDQTGRITKSNQTIHLTSNKIKEKLGLSLTEKEEEIEKKLKLGV